MTEENKAKTPFKKRTIEIKKGGRSAKRSISAQDLEQSKIIEKERLAAEQAELEAKKNGQAAPETAPLDKAALTTEYTTKLATYSTLAQSLAAVKTDLAKKNTQYEALQASTQVAVEKLEAQFKADKKTKISAFINELHDIQNAIGNTAQELQALADGNEPLARFVEGVTLTNEGLTKVFNKFAPTTSDEAPTVTSAPIAPVVFEAKTFPALDITDNTPAEEIAKSLADLDTAIQTDTQGLAKTTEQINKVSAAIAGASAESEKTLARAAQTLEKNSAYVLEKVAKEVLEVADNIERSLSVVQDQKDALGDLYGTVEDRMNKASHELQDAFNKFGIQKADTKVGQKQNLKTDNAIAQVPAAAANANPGEIIEVASIGYVLKNDKHGDRVLRDSQVIMAI